MKKIFTLILFSMIAFSAIHAEITWTLSDDGTLTISGTDMPNYHSNNLPWHSQLNEIKKVVIENKVTNIGRNAFSACKNLVSVTISNSVTSIGEGAFYDCSSLTSITIPNSVTSIGGNAFYGCSNLTSITIPESVTVIGHISDCSNITLITVEKGNKKFDSRNDCNAIIATESNILVVGCKNTVIPNSVTTIGKSAFSGCTGLSSVTIPNSVTSIREDAFYGCSGLTSVIIPESVTSIGSNAFSGARLRNVVIKAKTPPSGESFFSDQAFYHAILMIPEGCWDAYAYNNYWWYKFINIREMAYNAVNLTNSKAYMLKSATEGSYLFYDSVNDCVDTLNETAFDDTEENNTWMTVEVDGKNYVYNLGAKKFLVANANSDTGYSLSDTPVSIDIEDGKDAIVVGKDKEFYMVINDKLNVDEGLESQIMTSTGINEIDVESNKPTITYNLNGQRINKAHARKGIYIKNGRKYAK